MKTVSQYLQVFFNNIIMDSDKKGHSYKVILYESIKDFLIEPNKTNAYIVYRMFFDVYRLGRYGKKSFIDLLDLLRGYEENTATLSDKQRDHYIHSVNVFILGLCIYAQNIQIRDAFHKEYSSNNYINVFSTKDEEFLFNWGLTSLFHDIGYPLEIINNQVNKFIEFVAEDEQKSIGPYIAYNNFSKLNIIEKDLESQFCPTDLMSCCISKHLRVDYLLVKSTLDGFVGTMQKNGFVDHGFYSAIIMLRWYGEILLKNSDLANIFYTQIVNTAGAIFLHNAYKNIFLKKPYLLDALNVYDYPLAYLLILCDEAQEWNREAYGAITKTKIAVDDSAIEITDNHILFHYITNRGWLNDQFLLKKKELLYRLLNIDSVFSNGLNVTATVSSEQYISNLKKAPILPRLLVENIEELAKQIHLDYNHKQKERHPDREIEYPTWKELPDTLKYSNIRQAQSIVEKLSYIDCYVNEEELDKAAYKLSPDDIEVLACIEHNLWVEERIKNGWKYGKIKDVELKTSPFLIPYDELTEDIKDLDRDTIKNIKNLLSSVGLAIYKNE